MTIAALLKKRTNLVRSCKPQSERAIRRTRMTLDYGDSSLNGGFGTHGL
jgi:hypothetical protein